MGRSAGDSQSSWPTADDLRSADRVPEVAQLVGIADGPHGKDLLVGNVERHDDDRAALGIEEDSPGLSVDLRETEDVDAQLPGPLPHAGQQLGHPFPAEDGHQERGCLPTAVTVGGDIGGGGDGVGGLGFAGSVAALGRRLAR